MLEGKIFKMQIEDRACTICAYVYRGGKICKECLENDGKPLWELQKALEGKDD